MLRGVLHFIPIFILLAGGFSSASANSCSPKKTRQFYERLFPVSEASHLKPEVIEHEIIASPNRTPGARPLSFSEFKEKFPFHPNQSSDAQTWINWNHTPHEIIGYDEVTGRVTLARNELRTENLSTLKKMNAGNDIKEGMIFHLKNNQSQLKPYEVVALDLHNEIAFQKINLARREVSEVPLSQLSQALENPIRLKKISHAALEQPVMPLIGDQVKLISATQEPFVYPNGSTTHFAPEEMKTKYHLRDDHLVHLTFFDGKKKIIKLKDFTGNNFALAKEVIAYASPDSPEVVARYFSLNSPDTNTTMLYNMTPIQSHVYEFEIPAQTGARRIKVYAPRTENAAQDIVDQRKIQDFLKNIPEPLAEYVDVIHFDPGRAGIGQAASSKASENILKQNQVIFYRSPSITHPNIVKTSFVSDILDRPEITHSMWHELFHNFEDEMQKRIPGFQMTLWEDAIIKDGAWATNYSRVSPLEDRPETGMLYVATDGGRLDPKLRAKFKHRFEFLDRALKP